jgi:hypothetical protein
LKRGYIKSGSTLKFILSFFPFFLSWLHLINIITEIAMTVIELRDRLEIAIKKGLQNYPVKFPHPDSGRVEFEVGIVKVASDAIVLDEAFEATPL